MLIMLISIILPGKTDNLKILFGYHFCLSKKDSIRVKSACQALNSPLAHHQNATWVVDPFMESGQHPPAMYAYIRLRVLLPPIINHQLSIFKIVLPCIWHPAGDQEIIEMIWKSNGYKIRRWIFGFRSFFYHYFHRFFLSEPFI